MFCYKEGHLVLEQSSQTIPIQNLAQDIKSPFYLYDLEGIKDWYKLFLNTLPEIEVFFAMKANNNREILKIFQKEGAGVDLSSQREAERAMETGFSPKKTLFSGVGKTKEEISLAIQKGFLQINVESMEELKVISQTAKELKKEAFIGLRINPDMDFESHPHIKTGLKGHKFGFEEKEIPGILDFIRIQDQNLCFQGLSMHIGSQIFDLHPLYKAIKALKQIYENLQKEGHPLKIMDIGGGLGVNYQDSDLEGDKKRLLEFGKGLKQLLKGFSGRVFTEPGRFLVARFGLLCTKVEYIKKAPPKQFAILNSGMNHLLRPALYGEEHRILTFLDLGAPKEFYDVVGPICETGDTFAKNCLLAPLNPGDWLAIADTGAYGHVMSSDYNLQIPVQEIPVFEGRRL